MRKTLGLSMILKDEADKIGAFLDLHQSHFDKVFILDTGSTDDTVKICRERGCIVTEVGDEFLQKPTKKQLETMRKYDAEIPDDFRAFHFGDARQRAFQEVDTDYVIWLDPDDKVDFGPMLYKNAIQDIDPKYDAYFWQYDYAQDEHTGETVALHWRERLIKMPTKLVWKGMVHETCIHQDEDYLYGQDDTIVVHHTKPYGDHKHSHLRNLWILLYEFARDGDKTDPRIMQYLGTTMREREKYEEAIFFLTAHIEKSGWDEDIYRSWKYIADVYFKLSDYDRAEFALQRALTIKTDWPDAWLGLAECYLEKGNYDRCLEYLDIAMRRKHEKDLSVVDPTLYTYKPIAMALIAYMNLGMVEEGWICAQKLLELAPNHPITQENYPRVREVFYEREFFKNLDFVLDYMTDKSPDDTGRMFNALPRALLLSSRGLELKAKYLTPKEWEDNSVVFVCGGVEEWSPENVKQGIGGSEEAVIYLTKELAKLGWQVTVYNTISEEREFDGVTYTPAYRFNPADKFNVFVAWRNPTLAAEIPHAKLKCVDFHDAPVGHQEVPGDVVDRVDKFLFKSKFQRDIAQHIPDEKAVVISNGITRYDFRPTGVDGNPALPKRNPMKAIFASSADRGLDFLVKEIWPLVTKEVPDAELHWFYGFDTYDKFFSGDTQKMKWKWQLIKAMNDQGVVNGGRIGHKELAHEFMTAGVWVYPTAFPEINAITALKAQAAGCTPVTSGYAALQETVVEPQEDLFRENDFTYSNAPLWTDEEKQAFADRVVDAMVNPEPESKRQDRAKFIMENWDWKEIARRWDGVLRNGETYTKLPSRKQAQEVK